MKNLILITSLLALVSCGNNIRKTIGADYDNKITKTDDRIKDLEDRISALESKALDSIAEMSLVQVKIDELEGSNTSLSESLTNYSNNLQAQINNLSTQVLALQSNDSVSEFIDPCGDGVGFDEVIMRTKSGKLVAYFEQGSMRFLSVLSEGHYRTTDQQACNFSVDSEGNVL